MSKITPCLWFDGKAEEAARFYVSLLPDSRVDNVQRMGMDWPGGKAGGVVMVEFTLAGQPYSALYGGPHYQFTPAVSFSVSCADQAEVDRLWSALGDGGAPLQCGWITDRYGLSWQIVPEGAHAPDEGSGARPGPAGSRKPWSRWSSSTSPSWSGPPKAHRGKPRTASAPYASRRLRPGTISGLCVSPPHRQEIDHAASRLGYRVRRPSWPLRCRHGPNRARTSGTPATRSTRTQATASRRPGRSGPSAMRVAATTTWGRCRSRVASAPRSRILCGRSATRAARRSARRSGPLPAA